MRKNPFANALYTPVFIHLPHPFTNLCAPKIRLIVPFSRPLVHPVINPSFKIPWSFRRRWSVRAIRPFARPWPGVIRQANTAANIRSVILPLIIPFLFACNPFPVQDPDQRQVKYKKCEGNVWRHVKILKGTRRRNVRSDYCSCPTAQQT